jgi:hypothetical protein
MANSKFGSESDALFSCYHLRMRDLIVLLVHLITTVLRITQPGGLRSGVAESVLIKHQLLIVSRSRRRAPHLRVLDRLIAGFCSLWIKPKRLFAIGNRIETTINAVVFPSCFGSAKVSPPIFAKPPMEAWTEGSKRGSDSYCYRYKTT